MAGGARELEYDLAVPGQSEPGEAVDDGGDGCGSRALAVGVLDSQQHLAAAVACIEPVEQRRSGSADMEEAGRGRRKTGNDGLTHRRPCTTLEGRYVSAIDIEPSAKSCDRPPQGQGCTRDNRKHGTRGESNGRCGGCRARPR